MDIQDCPAYLYTEPLYDALQARHHHLFERGDILCLGHNEESDHIENICSIIQILSRLHRGEPYKTLGTSGKSVLTGLGKTLHQLLQIPFEHLCRDFHSSQLHPYVQLAQSAVAAVEARIQQGLFHPRATEPGRHSVQIADCMAEVILQGLAADELR